MGQDKAVGSKITDEMVAKVRDRIGIEEPLKAWFNEEATRDTVRHFALGIGDLNPLWLDDEYAEGTRFKGRIAPPTFLFSCAWSGRLGMPGVHGMFSGSDWEFLIPARLGDRISVTTKVVDLIEKPSRFSGRQFHQIFEINYRNQHGETIAINRMHGMRQERDAAHDTGKYDGITTKHWSPEELEEVWAGYDREEIRGSNPRYWEDVTVGDELTPVVKGPLTVRDCIAWCMGGGSIYVKAHRDAYRFMKRHPAGFIPDEYGIPDVPERVHWTPEFALKVGVPGVYDYGPQRVSWLAHLMTNWAGDDGWLKEMKIQVRQFNIVGDVQWCKGSVTDKYEKDGEHIVECQIRAENQRGEVTAPGVAKVVLPTRGK